MPTAATVDVETARDDGVEVRVDDDFEPPPLQPAASNAITLTETATRPTKP